MEKRKASLIHKYSRKILPLFFTFLFASIFCLFFTNTAIVSNVLNGQMGTVVDYNNYLEWLHQTVLDLNLDFEYQDKNIETKTIIISCDHSVSQIDDDDDNNDNKNNNIDDNNNVIDNSNNDNNNIIDNNDENDNDNDNEDDDDEVDREFEASLILPENITTAESRVAWYASKLPEANFFKSDELALQFQTRVSDFINEGCSVKFFMTWFSPSNRFGKRISFAMESIFKTHPKACLIIVSRTMDTNRGYQTLKPLIDRGFRVMAATPNVDFLVNKTPAEDWIKAIKNGKKDPGLIPLPQNLSNLLRLAILYRFGGIYLDTDYIILRDMSGLKNIIGAQSLDSKTKRWTRLNNAALIFDVRNPILLEFIREFSATFNGNRWGYNGPYMVSRVVEKVSARRIAKHVQVLPPKAFYPVNWNEIQRLLKKPLNESESDWVDNKFNTLKDDNNTYGIHLWNARIRGLKIEEGSVLGRLISELCIVCEDIYD